jgi:Osmosensitive K+ channel histidine kinase
MTKGGCSGERRTAAAPKGGIDMIRRGKLKIYFGYSSGVGKTYTMLKDAHQELRRGVDIVVGYINPNSGSETLELMEGLEILPFKLIASSRGMLEEFNLEGALLRMPRVILVDDMAHANAEGTKYEKRFQDIEELLSFGIDVYTTVNAQQIESLNQKVTETLKVPYGEKIPDFIFDCAERVELIDPDPDELLRRYHEGKITILEKPESKARIAFKKKNLDMLRELSIKRTKERIDQVCNWS